MSSDCQPQVTILRDYSEGVNEMKFVLPTGAYDPARHSSATAAGEAELSEEVCPYSLCPNPKCMHFHEAHLMGFTIVVMIQ